LLFSKQPSRKRKKIEREGKEKQAVLLTSRNNFPLRKLFGIWLCALIELSSPASIKNTLFFKFLPHSFLTIQSSSLQKKIRKKNGGNV
jgi:hypothetical protein